ncbi:hypothetical protein KKB40_04470 [Patescibacteria group bacterium]|nr:hypothetical protein [Patescibacteria group bacterium]
MTTNNNTTNQKNAQSENQVHKSAKKIDRYLVDIKELPPISYENEGGDEEEKEVKRKTSHQTYKPVSEAKVDSPPAKKESPDNSDEKPATRESVTQMPSENEEVVEKRKLPFSPRDIILGIINLISLALLIIILTKFPDKAQELKELRIQNVKNESSVSFEFVEIEASKEKTHQLEDLFLDEAGIVNFVGRVEELKTEGGAIDKITFASQEVTKDKTGNYGIPVIIELNGTWESIGQDLQEIQKLPFLLRAISINAEPDKDRDGMIKFGYGGFLYVDTRLGEN